MEAISIGNSSLLIFLQHQLSLTWSNSHLSLMQTCPRVCIKLRCSLVDSVYSTPLARLQFTSDLQTLNFISHGLRMQLKAEVLLHFVTHKELFYFIFFKEACLKQKAQPFTGKPAVCLSEIQSELAWNLVPIPFETWLGTPEFSNRDSPFGALAWFCVMNTGVVLMFEIQTRSPTYMDIMLKPVEILSSNVSEFSTDWPLLEPPSSNIRLHRSSCSGITHLTLSTSADHRVWRCGLSRCSEAPGLRVKSDSRLAGVGSLQVRALHLCTVMIQHVPDNPTPPHPTV